jgi:hypothetical protein
LCPNALNSPTSISNFRIFTGDTPDPPLKGREEKEDGRGGGLGIQMGRRGIVWDREGE